MHQVRRGWRGRPRRDGRWRLLLVVALVVLAVAAGLVVLAHRAAARPVPGVADARGAHLVAAGPAPSAYPWSLPATNPATADEDAAGVDPNGFLRATCASYVAWWLGTHGVPFARATRGPHGTATFGDAGGWDAAAREAGFAVSSAPRVGSIAQWHAGERSPQGGPREATLQAGARGHVAVVQAVLPDGSVLVVGENGDTHRLERVRTRAPRYLEIGLSPAKDLRLTG